MIGHPTILTIAGSDSSGGAGIQADLKTIAAHGCYGASVITAVTAQNSTAIKSILQMPDFSIQDQFDALMEDLDVVAIKIGMLGNKETIMIVSKLLEELDIPIILDPIMISSSGATLLEKEAVDILKEELFPKVYLLTPNIPEAIALSGKKIETLMDMQEACTNLGAKNVLIKGGHCEGNIITDLLYCDGVFNEFTHRKIPSQNTHGTGCTLSSAIACNIALGDNLDEACDKAVKYVAKAILESYPTGKRAGSLNHLYNIKGI